MTWEAGGGGIGGDGESGLVVGEVEEGEDAETDFFGVGCDEAKMEEAVRPLLSSPLSSF